MPYSLGLKGRTVLLIHKKRRGLHINPGLWLLPAPLQAQLFEVNPEIFINVDFDVVEESVTGSYKVVRFPKIYINGLI